MAATSLDSTLEDLLQSPSIPDRRQVDISCCCGRPSCAYLSHNNAALDDLEKAVRTAAQLGQALLARHEAYMAEAEQSRKEMSMRIETLEADKKHLELENSNTIQENRGLLEQLEGLNSTIAESDTHVKSIEATLQSTRQELRRLEIAAARTHDLEIQLAALEEEQAILQRNVSTSEVDERTAIRRWKKAESDLQEVQEQLEKIEREAKEEREKHVEVVGRMERQRNVEKELEVESGQLKGTAAVTTLDQSKLGSGVVSHFVKDILQDNANLQMGIVELREMLMNSNDEVQTLREQLMMHQPADEGNDNTSGRSTLRAEGVPQEPQLLSQELHIHHHYHAANKKEEIRRPKKKRNAINPALFTPPHARIQQVQRTSASAILSETSVTVPHPRTPGNRWSMQSGQTMSDFTTSSAPSSPQSNFRSSNLFDRSYIDQMLDSSRPTSPGSSLDPGSPSFQPHHRKHGSEQSARSFNTTFYPGTIIHEEEDDDVQDLPDLRAATTEIMMEPTEAEESLPSIDSEEPVSTDDVFSPFAFNPRLHRSTSHESVLSIAGADIHTLKSRPSQLTITQLGAVLPSRSQLGLSSTTMSYVSSQPIFTSPAAASRTPIPQKRRDSTSYLRSSVGLPEVERPASITSSNSTEGGITRKVGGWVWGRWGVSSTASPAAQSRAQSSEASTPVRRVMSTPGVEPVWAMMGRAPGINQKGPIPGFRKKEGAPSKVTPERVDQDALREVLAE